MIRAAGTVVLVCAVIVAASVYSIKKTLRVTRHHQYWCVVAAPTLFGPSIFGLPCRYARNPERRV